MSCRGGRQVAWISEVGWLTRSRSSSCCSSTTSPTCRSRIASAVYPLVSRRTQGMEGGTHIGRTIAVRAKRRVEPHLFLLEPLGDELGLCAAGGIERGVQVALRGNRLAMGFGGVGVGWGTWMIPKRLLWCVSVVLGAEAGLTGLFGRGGRCRL